MIITIGRYEIAAGKASQSVTVRDTQTLDWFTTDPQSDEEWRYIVRLLDVYATNPTERTKIRITIDIDGRLLDLGYDDPMCPMVYRLNLTPLRTHEDTLFRDIERHLGRPAPPEKILELGQNIIGTAEDLETVVRVMTAHPDRCAALTALSVSIPDPAHGSLTPPMVHYGGVMRTLGRLSLPRLHRLSLRFRQGVNPDIIRWHGFVRELILFLDDLPPLAFLSIHFECSVREKSPMTPKNAPFRWLFRRLVERLAFDNAETRGYGLQLSITYSSGLPMHLGTATIDMAALLRFPMESCMLETLPMDGITPTTETARDFVRALEAGRFPFLKSITGYGCPPLHLLRRLGQIPEGEILTKEDVIDLLLAC